MAAIFRDAPAGQILRLFFGKKIAPYTDEKEGFELSRTISKPQAPPSDNNSSEALEGEKAAESDNEGGHELEKEKSHKDVEDDAHHPGAAHANANSSVVEWIGPEDEDNPQNWSTLKKSFVFAQICLLTFSSMDTVS